MPLGSAHELQIPLLIASELAVPLLTLQLRVVLWPALIVMGEAVKLSETGTVTVAVAVTLAPPEPVAVSVNVVVLGTATPASEPEAASGVFSSPCWGFGEIEMEVAFAVCHVSVVDCPAATVAGLAEKETIWGLPPAGWLPEGDPELPAVGPLQPAIASSRSEEAGKKTARRQAWKAGNRAFGPRVIRSIRKKCPGQATATNWTR